MYETAISVISNYLDTHLSEQEKSWRTKEFKNRSYARWAATEILEKIIEEGFGLPSYLTGREPLSVLDIIINVKSEFEYCYEKCTDREFQTALLIAIDTADEIGCLFI